MVQPDGHILSVGEFKYVPSLLTCPNPIGLRVHFLDMMMPAALVVVSLFLLVRVCGCAPSLLPWRAGFRFAPLLPLALVPGNLNKFIGRLLGVLHVCSSDLDLDTMSIAAATGLVAQAAAAFAWLLSLVGVYFWFLALVSVIALLFGGLLSLGGLLLFILSAAATTVFFWKIAAAAACQLVGPAAALVLVDTSGCLFPESVAGTRNAVLFLFPGILVCGLVLGLRVVSLTRRIRSGVPARFWDLLQFNFAPMIGATWVLATTTVGPRIACRAQATPRVDVDVARRCALLPVVQVPGTHEHPAKTSGRFQVFVKGLDGHTLVIARCSDDLLVDDFLDLVAMRARVPVACFYLVGAGSKALRLGMTLSHAGVVGHSLLFMASAWLLALLRV